MKSYFLRRLLLIPPTLLGITFFVFAITRFVPGGPMESFRAVLEICARIGQPLRRGMQVTTGAVTGVHPIRAGQSAKIEMAGLPAIECRAAMAPTSQAQSNPA